SLMTGKHMGHCSVRANDGGTPLRAGEATIASMLKKKGYATGGFGKWGAGGRDSTGVPEAHGFDVFFGYYDQVHAHSFYPPYLVRNSEEIKLPGNIGGRTGKTYSHYEIMKEGLKFIRENRERPFFCYLPITPPHGMYDIPDSDPAWQEFKEKKDWPEDAKRYAAMVKMVDRNVGEVLDLLEELKLQENTIVFFCGDNGGQDRFRTPDHPRGFFGPNVHPKTGVEFRGGKGSLYEGGLKIPSLVYWPGKIQAQAVSDLIWYQADVFPTLTELVDGEAPADLDGLSILPTILGEAAVGRKQEQHEMLYWEFGGQLAVRYGQWKGIKMASKAAQWALYDLSQDVSETIDLSQQQPAILEKMKQFAKDSHVPVQPGKYTTRERHERDRWAKWGEAKPPAPKLKKVTRWNSKGLLDSSTFKLIKISSENKGNAKFAKMAFDQDPRTWWHSDWSANPKKIPHEIVIDLGGEKQVSGLRYLARQDGSWNGTIAQLKVSIWSDGNREQPVTFQTRFQKSRKIQNFKFKSTRGRFLSIQPLAEINSNAWASAAEFGIIGN
ncbi:MAG: sulfatase-like hydrolase/transferase, partial [Planctomycetota bacterium]|nr:sulfatase-like hydrolase/transferase [Planctomycetota bacterium]